MLVICCLTRVINGKIIEDEAIYNFWRFLVEDFFLPVIKPPGTYFNNKLLPSCRSSKFSSSFPATSVLLCAPLDPIRPDRNSKSAWRQSVLLFLRQTLHWKLRSWRAATFLIPREAPSREVYNLVAREARGYHTNIARPAWFSLGYKSIEFGWCPPWRHPE